MQEKQLKLILRRWLSLTNQQNTFIASKYNLDVKYPSKWPTQKFTDFSFCCSTFLLTISSVWMAFHFNADKFTWVALNRRWIVFDLSISISPTPNNNIRYFIHLCVCVFTSENICSKAIICGWPVRSNLNK